MEERKSKMRIKETIEVEEIGKLEDVLPEFGNHTKGGGIATLRCDLEEEHTEHVWKGKDGFEYLCSGIVRIPQRLYKEDAKVAGLYDICRWWIHAYPRDIFVNTPKEVVQVRELMDTILAMQRTKTEEETERKGAE